MATTTSSSSAPSRVNMSEHRLNALDWIALVLVIVGAVNWGLVGIFNFDLVATIFGSMSTLTRIVYALVGLAGLYTAYLLSVLRR